MTREGGEGGKWEEYPSECFRSRMFFQTSDGRNEVDTP